MNNKELSERIYGLFTKEGKSIGEIVDLVKDEPVLKDKDVGRSVRARLISRDVKIPKNTVEKNPEGLRNSVLADKIIARIRSEGHISVNLDDIARLNKATLKILVDLLCG